MQRACTLPAHPQTKTKKHTQLMNHHRTGVQSLWLLLVACSFSIPAEGVINLTQNFTLSSSPAIIGPTGDSETLDPYDFFRLTVDQFDPSLGTLETVQIDFELDFLGTGTTGSSSGGLNMSLIGNLSANGDEFDGTGNGGGTGGGPNTVLSLPVDLDLNKSYDPFGDSANIAAEVIGTGTFELLFQGDILFAANTLGTSDGTLDFNGGTVSWTYGYTAIPEPSTYTLTAGAIGFITIIIRRKLRRK